MTAPEPSTVVAPAGQPVGLSPSAIGVPLGAAIGLSAGMLGGLFGVGGGLIVVPSLLVFARMDRRLAHGTALGSTLLIGVASVATYLYHGNVDWPIAAMLTAGSIAGAIIGTSLLRVVSKEVLVYVFVATVLATAVRLFMTNEVDGRDSLTVWTAILLVAVGLLAGTLAGLLGIGGGVVMVPVMVVVLGMAPVLAKGTSAAVIVPTALMGTIRNRRHRNTDLRTALVIGAFGAASAVVGASIAEQLSDRVSNVLFGVLLVVVAITQLLTLRTSDSELSAALGDGGEV